MRHWVLAGLLFSFGIDAWALPRIGLVEFYGLKEVRREDLLSVIRLGRGDWVPVNFDARVGEKELRQAFEIPDGATLPQNEGDIIRRIKSLKGVRDAKLAAICCEADRTTTLFVGIQETPVAGFEYRKSGQKPIVLPPAIVSVYDGFTEALSEAVRKGNAREDDSDGHSLFSDEKLQKFTREFVAYARDNTPLLAEVMSESSDHRERATAAWIVAYGPDKKLIASELLPAVRDENEQVRNNATRSLAPIITFSQREPSLGIRIDPGPFIQMLHSLSWSDRNKAMMVLLALTEARPPEILRAVHAAALDSLVEMAGWQDSHNRIALILLARIAGLPDAAVEDLAKRPVVINRAMRKKFLSGGE